MSDFSGKDASLPATAALRFSRAQFWAVNALSISRFACLTALIAGSWMPQASTAAGATKSLTTATLSADGRSLALWGNTCKLSAIADRARVSSDGNALIVSGHGYIERAQLQACGNMPVTVREIPRQAGRLEDVNLASGRYIALLPVSAAPMLYVALVARMGSLSSLVAQPVAWQSALPIGTLQQQGFSYDEVAGPFARFSPDGHYVAPNGEPDCSQDAYPGVWNLQSGKRVEISDATDCQALFAPVAPKVGR